MQSREGRRAGGASEKGAAARRARACVRMRVCACMYVRARGRAFGPTLKAFMNFSGCFGASIKLNASEDDVELNLKSRARPWC
jgi:hypothetical protein